MTTTTVVSKYERPRSCFKIHLYQYRLAPVIQVVNLELYLCLSPGIEPQVGRTFDFICKNISQKDSIAESALQRG